MRKFFPIILMALASTFAVSCDNNDDVIVQDNQANVTKVRDVTANFNSGNNFTVSQGINIQNTDVVLVYRNINSNGGGGAVWQLIPKTFYLQDVTGFATGRELDYNFDFTTGNMGDVEIRTEANFNQSNQLSTTEVSRYLTNQVFRIVLITAYANKSATAPVDYSDYNSVIKYYNLDDSNVKNTVIK